MKLKNLIGKYAFISHPYAGNPTQNKIKVDKVCKYWAKKGIASCKDRQLEKGARTR